MSSNCLTSPEFLFGMMKKVLEMDSDDGGATVSAINVTDRALKMVKVENFILYIFYYKESTDSLNKVK